MMQDALLTQQVEVMLDMHTKKVLVQVAELKAELASLREEIRKEFKDARRAPPQPNAGGQFAYAPAPGHDQQGVPVPQGSPAQNRPVTSPIDRNGVAPADVSIEKIFYSGGK